MEGKDNIRELFSDKLGNYKAKVNPELWGKVASQIGATSATVGTGVSVLTKWLIGLGLSAATVTTVVLVMNSSEVEEVDTVAETAQTQEVGIKEDNPEVKIDTQPALQTGVEVHKTAPEGNDLETPPIIAVRVEEPLVIGLPVATPSRIEKSNPAPAEPEKNTTPSDLGKTEVTNPTPGSNSEPETDPEPAEIDIEPDFSISQYTNIFSPNGDRINDEFYLEIDGIEDFSIIVINNQGSPVFRSDNVNFRWDGRNLGGEPVPAGNYVYMLTGKDKNGKIVAETKSLMIAR